jgi:hypothetical protein
MKRASHVSAEEAAAIADCCCFEWRYGRGVLFDELLPAAAET